MSELRKRTYSARMPDDKVCAVCRRNAFTPRALFANGRAVCFNCSWAIVEGLGREYNAPELTVLGRIRHVEKHGKEAPKKPATSDANEPGWVYYIRNGDTVKIGYAADISKRMRAYPPNAELLAAHPGTKDLEKQMQKRFAEHLVRGREWFAPADELMDHVASVVAQFGDVSHMAYEYTRPKTQEEKVASMFSTRKFAEIARGAHSA